MTATAPLPSSHPAMNTKTVNPGAPRLRRAFGYEIDVTSVQSGTVMPKILASCGVGGRGGTCKISQTVSTSGTLSASGGVDIDIFNANSGYTITKQFSTTIESTSPKMHGRQMYVARPQGTFYIFKWRKYVAGIQTGSGSGTAFSPTGVQYRVVAS